MDYEINRDFVDFQCFGVNNVFVHYHKSIEFVYAVKGDIICHINGSTEELKEGELILIPPFYSHSYFAPENQVTKVFCLTVSISDYYIKNISSVFQHEIVLRNKNIAKKIIDTLGEITSSTSNLLKESTYQYCIAKFIENVAKITDVKSDKQLFLKIIEYINNHYKENVTLESISTYFNYSKCYFSSIFNQLFNQSLNSFLNVVRIQNAIEMLNTKTATQIAYEVGYENLQSFFYNFKKIVGCTPKKYFHSTLRVTK